MYNVRVGCRCASFQSTVSTFSARVLIHVDSLGPSDPFGHRSMASPNCDVKLSQMLAISRSIWSSCSADGCCSSRRY